MPWMWILCVALAATPPDAPLPKHLYLHQALHLFRTQAWDLTLLEAAVESIQGDLSIAQAWANPLLNATAGRAWTYRPQACGAPGCSAVYGGIQLSDQALIADALTGKRGLRIKVAHLALRAAQQDRAHAQRTLEFLLKVQFLQALLAKGTLKWAQQVQSTLSKTAELFEIRYRQGAISETDVARVQTAALQAQQLLDSLEAADRSARLQLAFLLGIRDPLPVFDVEGPWLENPAPAPLNNATEAQLWTWAQKHRSDLHAAHLQQQRAQAALDLSRRRRIPDMSLTLAYSQQGTGQNALTPPLTTLNLTTALPIFSFQEGEMAKAYADVKTQSTQVLKIQAQIFADVAQAWSAYTTARSKLQRMRAHLLERAERALTLVRLQYDTGATSLLDLLDAQRTAMATHVEYLDNLSDYWTAVFQLEQAVDMEWTP